MGEVLALDDIGVRASDLTGQRSRHVRVPRDATIGEWVEGLVGSLGLKPKDADGHPYAYRPRLDREGRHLNASEVVGDVLREDDHVVLHPTVMAG